MQYPQTRYQDTLGAGISSVDLACTANLLAPTRTEGILTIGRLAVGGGPNVEDVYFTNVVGNIITIGIRGLSQTALTLTNVPGNQKVHAQSESLEITTHHNYITGLLRKDTDDSVTGTITFTTAPRIAQINDTAGNIVIVTTPTASAVNYVNLTNGATGNSAKISAKGSDTDVDLELSPQGSGHVILADGARTKTNAPPSDEKDLVNKKYADAIATFNVGGTGVDGDLTVNVGTTTTLNLNQIYNYNNVTINGTLKFTGSGSVGLINVAGTFAGNGTIEMRNSTTGDPTVQYWANGYPLKGSNLSPVTATPNAGGLGTTSATANYKGGDGGTSTAVGVGNGGAGGAIGSAGTNGQGGGSVVGGNAGGGGGGAGSNSGGTANAGSTGGNGTALNGGVGGAGGSHSTSSPLIGGSGGGGGGGYDTGNGGAGGVGGSATSPSVGTGSCTSGNGGGGGASGANGGTGGAGGNGGAITTGGAGNVVCGAPGNGGWGYSLGGAGGSPGAINISAGVGTFVTASGGNGGSSTYGTGGAGGSGAAYTLGAAAVLQSTSGGNGGEGRVGGAGGSGGTATGSTNSAGGNGGNGGNARNGCASLCISIRGNSTFTGTINAQGGAGGAGGNGGMGPIMGNGGNGGNGSDGADVLILSIGTMAAITINNTGGTGGTRGKGYLQVFGGAATGNSIPIDGISGRNGIKIAQQLTI